MDKKNILTVVIILILIAGGYFAYAQYRKNNPTDNSGDQTLNYDANSSQGANVTPTPTPTPSAAETVQSAVATFDTSEGTFKVSLDGKAAPQTVANFIKLSKQGFYNGLTFHRIVEGFMIQGGDPSGDGTGGPGYTVPAEIGLKHTKGAIAMARTGDAVNPTKASSGSQFYITLDDQPFLDGQYTVFGYVSEGMNVVEKIGKTPTEPNPDTGETSVPLKTITINKITISQEVK